jgi:hypothetical protein
MCWELFPEVKKTIENSTWPYYGMYKHCEISDWKLGETKLFFHHDKAPTNIVLSFHNFPRETEWFHSLTTALISLQQTYPVLKIES